MIDNTAKKISCDHHYQMVRATLDPSLLSPLLLWVSQKFRIGDKESQKEIKYYSKSKPSTGITSIFWYPIKRSGSTKLNSWAQVKMGLTAGQKIQRSVTSDTDIRARSSRCIFSPQFKAKDILQEALFKFGAPEIVNTDQGNQFTAE